MRVDLRSVLCRCTPLLVVAVVLGAGLYSRKGNEPFLASDYIAPDGEVVRLMTTMVQPPAPRHLQDRAGPNVNEIMTGVGETGDGTEG